jgi:ubiquinone biosynthesis protein COQ9
MPTAPLPLKDRLLDTALPHVAFDGWSEATFRAAVRDADATMAAARLACPRGAVDLAVAFHKRGDAQMVTRLKAQDLAEMRFRDRIALAVRLRLEAAGDAEAVRRGTTLFALPMHAAEGARLIWGTSDAIWSALGDTSDDVNWYTKRATLAGVYGSSVLFWLGDESPGHTETEAFVGRRIDDVMQIEKLKGQVRDNAVLSLLLAGPSWALGKIRAPRRFPQVDLPGHWRGAPPE